MLQMSDFGAYCAIPRKAGRAYRRVYTIHWHDGRPDEVWVECQECFAQIAALTVPEHEQWHRDVLGGEP